MRSFVHRLNIPAIPHKANRQREQGTHCGWKWNRFRNHVLAAHPLCQRCGCLGEEVHHIVPRFEAPERMYDASNCEVLCKRCHRDEHGRHPLGARWGG